VAYFFGATLYNQSWERARWS